MIANCQAGKPHGALSNAMGGLKLLNSCCIAIFSCVSSNSSAILRCERSIVLSLFTSLGLAWFPASSRSDAAVTAWFTSLRTFGDSCAWLGVGRLTIDLKYRRISTNTHLNDRQLNVIENTCLSKRGVVTCHCVFFFLRFF